MMTRQRKALILDLLRREGQVVAKTMAAEMGLSEDTIRRDLREMATEGLLLRVHGGALPVAPALPDFSARHGVSGGIKQALGARAAAMIRPGQMVFLDGGTTTAAIARHLPRDFAFTIVTHSPTIAGELEHHPTAEVILIGGRLYKHSMVATGAAAIAAISQLHPDLFFLGATAIHPARGPSTGDFEEAAVKRRIAAQAAETHVLITPEKLDAASPCQIMATGDLAGMIVPAGLAAEVLAPYRALGVTIIEA